MSIEKQTKTPACSVPAEGSSYLVPSKRPWVRQVARGMTVLLLLQSVLTVVPAQAQTVLPISAHTAAPAGQRPIMDAAQNGVPIVHIAPPSPAGVSRNQYENFNVNPNGLILNNSAANVQTQLGGWITANPQLGVTPARIILNEVVSANPSQLRGTMEVAGYRADIVVANPNGISCDGCGFLNTNRTSLSTGRVQFGSGGSISGFDVSQGQLAVGGNGLNASNLEQLDLIARGIVIEGEVWAQNLNVVAGANQVLYGTLTATAQSGNGIGPRFAIDIKDLGGMYANQVYMLATEKGLGVNSTGRMAALQGNLVLDANGDVRLQDTYAKQNITLESNSGNVTLAGQTLSDGSTSVTASAQIANSGMVDSGGQVSMRAGSFNNAGTLAQRNADGMTISSTGEMRNSGTLYTVGALDLRGASIVDSSGTLLSAGDIRMLAQSIDLTGTTLITERSARLSADSMISSQQAVIHAAEDISANAGTAINSSSTTWLAAGNISVSGGAVSSRTSVMSANGSLSIDARGTALQAQRGNGQLDNTQGQLIGSQALTIQAGEIRNDAGLIATGGSLELDTQGQTLANTDGTIVANGDVSIASARLENDDGTIASIAGALSITTKGQELSNERGRLQSNGNLSLASGTFNNFNGFVAGHHVNTATALFDNRAGQVAAGGNLTIESDELNNDAGLLQAIGSVVIDTQGNALVNANSGINGGIIAGSELSIAASSLDNQAGFIGSGGIQAISIAGDLDNRAANGTAGLLVTNASSKITATNVLNTGGSIAAVQNLDIAAGTIDNRGGQIAADGQASLIVESLDNSNQGTVGGAIDASVVGIVSTSINNTSGAIRASQNATLKALALTNANGSITAGGDLVADAINLGNTGGQLVGDASVTVTTSSESPAGTIASTNDVTLNVNGNYSNSGLLSAQRDLTVNATNITNSGALTAGDVLTANTGNLFNSGEISATVTNLNVDGTLTNTSTGLIDGVYTNIKASTTSNTGRIYGDVLRLQSNTLNNSGTGTIAARDTLLIAAQQVNNTNGGLIYSLGDLHMVGGLDANGNAVGRVQQLVNASARIESGGNMNLQVDNLYNRNDAFSTRIDTTVQPVNKTYIQPNGSVAKYDPAVLGWDPYFKEGSGRYVLPSDTYPIIQFGAVRKKLANEAYCFSWGSEPQPCPVVHHYPPEHSIWALFNVPPPYFGDLVKPSLPPGGGDCMRYGDSETRIEYGACGTYWQALDTYNATVAQRTADAEAALDVKITAFNSDVESRSFGQWYEYQITSQTVAETVVDSTQPAQILAGGNLTIDGAGTKLNNNSQIVAGGAIYIGGTSVVNQATEGTRTTTESGQVRFRRIEHHGGFSDSYEVELHPWYPTTGAPYVETFSLPSVSYVSYGGNQTIARNLAVQGATPSGITAAPVAAAASYDRAVRVDRVNAVLPGKNGTGAVVSAPTSSLFILHPEPAARYLVETDPRFTNYRTFLSSDYFLEALNRDPERQLKRYGDGFYEQRLVNDQILALTGRRYLSGYSDTQAEYKALMDAGIAFARQYQLSPGVALTAEQMALLTTDIVWLTTQTVMLADGQTQQVLVPQVYLRRPQDGDLQFSGALIAGNDVVIRTEEDIVNSGNIVADRSSTLIAGGDIVNQGGRIAGQDILAYAANDLKNLSGVIQGTGDASQVNLLAGRDIVLQTRTIASSTVASATTAASNRTSIDRIATVQGGNVRLEAARDMLAQGSSVNAQQDLIVTAGRDIKVASVESSYQLNVATGGYSRGRTGYIKEESTTNQVASFNTGGNMAVAAGNDLAIKGGDLAAGGDLVLQGQNVSIEAVRDSQLVDVQRAAKNVYTRAMRSDETLVGGNIAANNNLTVIANGKESGSGNIDIRGAYLTSEAGQVTAVASGDITVGALTTEHIAIDESYHKEKGLVGSKSTERSSTSITRQAEGSVISGNTIVMSAGEVGGTAGNITIKGSNVVADSDVLLSAVNDVTLTSEQQTFDSVFREEKRKSGLFSSGGASATWGKQQTNQDQTLSEVSNVGATVASLGGNVSINAGERFTQTGSQLLAPGGNIDVTAKQIDITAAIDSRDSEQETRFKQSGLTLALSSPVISAVQGIAQTVEAGSKTDDKRMQALAAATAVMQGMKAAETAQKLASAANTSVVDISLTVGSKTSESKQTNTSTTAVGSTVAAGGDLALRAVSDGKDSTITVAGSNVSAGGDALLKAEGDIDLRSAQSTVEQHSSNKSNSSGVGVAISVDKSGGAAVGVTAQASAARGKADGSDVIHTNTHVDAGDKLTIESGGDTNLAGAVVGGRQVVANIGGDLNIESLQDTSVYKSRDQSMGGSVTVGYGFSASASFSQTKIDADFASVTEQSGIRAGDGGFQIDVKGNTDLKGGAIASSEQAIENNFNRLSTATLTHSDIENRAEFSASSVSLAGSVSVSSNDTKDKEGNANKEAQSSDRIRVAQFGNNKGTSAGFGSESGSNHSTTVSGISSGVLVISDNDKQQALTGQNAVQAVAAVDRNIVSGQDSGGIAKNWDAQKLKDVVGAEAQITQAFMPLAAYAAGSFADGKQKEAERNADEAAKRGDKAAAEKYATEAKLWGESGAYRAALHSAVGALGGGVDGALGAAAGASVADLLNGLESAAVQVLQDAGLSDGSADAVAKGLTNLVATGVGAAVSGTAGATMALNVDANNRQLHPKEIDWAKKNAKSFANVLSDKLGRPVSEKEALLWLTTAGEANVDKVNQDLAAAQNGLSTTEQSRAFFAAKEYIKENAKGIAFVDDRGQQQKLFIATGTDFRNSTIYSEYRNDLAYRDFYWEVKGDNLKPDNPTPQELAIYKERERQRLLNNAKALATGAIPAVMAVAAGKVAAGTSKPGAATDARISSTPTGTKNVTVGDEPYSPNGLSDGGMAHPVAEGNSIPIVNRTQEVTELFNSTNPRSGIQLGNRSLLEEQNNGNAKIFSGATDAEVQQYFLELTGSSQMPAPRIIQGKGTIYVVPTPQGNFALRDFATSSGQTGSVWTIDLPKGFTGTTYNPEIKFKRSP